MSFQNPIPPKRKTMKDYLEDEVDEEVLHKFGEEGKEVD